MSRETQRPKASDTSPPRADQNNAPQPGRPRRSMPCGLREFDRRLAGRKVGHAAFGLAREGILLPFDQRRLGRGEGNGGFGIRRRHAKDAGTGAGSRFHPLGHASLSPSRNCRARSSRMWGSTARRRRPRASGKGGRKRTKR